MVTPAVFDNYIVDRLSSVEGVPKLYLRPKVPFGSDTLEKMKHVALRAVGASVVVLRAHRRDLPEAATNER